MVKFCLGLSFWLYTAIIRHLLADSTNKTYGRYKLENMFCLVYVTYPFDVESEEWPQHSEQVFAEWFHIWPTFILQILSHYYRLFWFCSCHDSSSVSLTFLSQSERPFDFFPEMCWKKCRKWIRIQKKMKAAQKMRITVSIEKNRYCIHIIKKCYEFF